MDPFLIKLNWQIDSSAHEAKRAQFVARRAIYYARVGRFDDAAIDVAWLRQGYGDGRYPQVSILTMLAEGVFFYFENLSDRAQERIARAYALASAMPSEDCLSLVGSWLAHIEFEASRYGRLATLLKKHLGPAEESDPSAHLRLCIVLADAFLYAGDRQSSQHWYNKARLLACSLGDRAALGAIMYNRAAFALSSARALRCAGVPLAPSLDPALLRAEARASLHYQHLTEVKALSHLSLVSIARADVLCGDYRSALDVFEPLASDLSAKERRIKSTSLSGELALCLLAVGRTDDAESLLASYSPEANGHLDLDDQVALVCSMREVASLLNKSSLLPMLRSAASEVIAAYLSDLQQLNILLSPWKPQILVEVSR